MHPSKYQELREAGPTISAEDHKRLLKFRPTPNPLVVAVLLALLAMRKPNAKR